MFYEVFGVSNMVGGMTYQWSDDVIQLLCHSISECNPAGNNGPEGAAIYVDLGEFIKFGGYCICGIKPFVSDVT